MICLLYISPTESSYSDRSVRLVELAGVGHRQLLEDGVADTDVARLFLLLRALLPMVVDHQSILSVVMTEEVVPLTHLGCLGDATTAEANEGDD